MISYVGLVRDFNEKWLRSGKTWQAMRYRGRAIYKNPCDLWQYTEIIEEVAPKILIELGTHEGGSALWFRDQISLVRDEFLVITIDLETPLKYEELIKERNLLVITGNSTSETIHKQVTSRVRQPWWYGGPVMVVADSEHTFDHVYSELDLYHDFVSPGSYFIVEDTNRGFLEPHEKDTPLQAVQKFIQVRGHPNGDWVIDTSKENQLLTANPSGYLKRVSNG